MRQIATIIFFLSSYTVYSQIKLINYPGIPFKKGDTAITEQGKNAILKAVEIMKADPKIKISLFAPTRSESEDVICRKRLDSIKKMMVASGISKERISDEIRPSDPSMSESFFNSVQPLPKDLPK